MKRLRVALLADYLEEGWPSMDLVAEMLLDRLSREHAATIDVTLIRPSLQRRLSLRACLWHRCIPPREMRAQRQPHIRQ